VKPPHTRNRQLKVDAFKHVGLIMASLRNLELKLTINTTQPGHRA